MAGPGRGQYGDRSVGLRSNGSAGAAAQCPCLASRVAVEFLQVGNCVTTQRSNSRPASPIVHVSETLDLRVGVYYQPAVASRLLCSPSPCESLAFRYQTTFKRASAWHEIITVRINALVNARACKSLRSKQYLIMK